MIALILSFLIAYQSTSTQQIDFAAEQLHFTVSDGYTKVRLRGCEINNIVGAPEIPTRALKIALPYGATDIGIQIIETETQILVGEFLLSCAQPPQVLSKDEPPPNSTARSGYLYVEPSVPRPGHRIPRHGAAG